MLHTLQGGACEGHPEGPGGDVQGSPAPHSRPLPALLFVPGEKVKSPQSKAYAHL